MENPIFKTNSNSRMNLQEEVGNARQSGEN